MGWTSVLHSRYVYFTYIEIVKEYLEKTMIFDKKLTNFLTLEFLNWDLNLLSGLDL